MRTLKPWAYGPFEILLHAEMHYRAGEDFDRRMAMVSFDNSIEVAITTYLSLHPVQRGGRTYAKTDVDGWLQNYHSKIDFFLAECRLRGLAIVTKQDEIIWFHGVRNNQYHVGGATVPQTRELDGVRSAALEIFSVLFDEPDVGTLLEEYIAAKTPPAPPPRTNEHDRLIDDRFGLVELCERTLYSSEVLYAFDPEWYREAGLELAGEDNVEADGDAA
jgi:hypothetical protein